MSVRWMPSEDKLSSRYCEKHVDGSHFVRSDNPMRTGRCEACRSFVGLTNEGWRAMSMRRAASLGLVGARAR